MAIQTIIANVGGTIETNFLDSQPTACTVSLYTDTGAAKVSAASCSIDAVSTTISSSAAAGATTVALASASGVVTGRRYRLGAVNASTACEAVTVKSLSSSTATLWAPLLYAHPSGDAFQGSRVYYAVTSTQANAMWWDGYADFVPTPAGDTQTEAVDSCLRKIPETLCDATDLRRVMPKLTKSVDAELDLYQALKEARDQFLIDLGGKIRAHTALGIDHFRLPCAMKFWLLRRFAFGDDWTAQMDKLAEDYKVGLARLTVQIPVDADQDGMTSGAQDGGLTSGRIGRA